jgi:hypothetical protein
MFNPLKKFPVTISMIVTILLVKFTTWPIVLLIGSLWLGVIIYGLLERNKKPRLPRGSYNNW